MKKIPDTITVPSDAKPTALNGSTVDGAIIGGVLGSVPGAVIGGAVGGSLGKRQMEQEYKEGQEIKKPKYRLLKIAASAVVMGLAVAAVAYFGFGIGLGTSIAAQATSYAFAAAGAVLGGMSANAAHNAQEKKYEAAQQYFVQHGGNYEGRDREMEKSIQITAAENAELNRRLAALETKSFTQGVAQPQQQASAQR